MAISILNNISALAAENQINLTQTSLQKTLAELSSGQRINSGSDDAAGLAIANGLQANVSALTQSVQNATAGSGMLQVADGALSQVTSLLNRAVTLATEASNGTVAPGQFTAMNNEFSNIVSEINSIGSNTYYNGKQVFSGSALNVFMGDGSQTMSVSSTLPTLTASGLGLNDAAATSTLYATANSALNDNVTIGAQTYTFKAAPAAQGQVQEQGTVGASMAALVSAINGTDGVNTANASVTATLVNNNTIQLTAKDPTVAGATIASTVGAGAFGFSSGATFSGGGSAINLLSTASAANVLTAANTAVQTVATDRGNLGASINQLTAATNVINTQIQNLTQSESGIMSADIPTAVANMTKFNILQQTGMAALSQSNQMQQAVLKLLQ
ncbi:MAG: flagellin [Terriglobales bacterium]